MPNVLLTGTFTELLKTRRLAFESAGYQVSTTEDITDACRLIMTGSFDAVVIGHAVGEFDRTRLARVLTAKRPSPRVICLYLGSIRNAEVADAVLQVTSPVEALVHAVNELISSGKRREHSG